MNPDLWRTAGQVESALREIEQIARNGFHAEPDVETMKASFALIERRANEALFQSKEITEELLKGGDYHVSRARSLK